MALFPITSPHIGLSISPQTLCAVEVGRDWRSGWRGVRLRQCRTRELPAGLIRPSASEPNVANVTTLTDHLQTLLDGRRSLSVALSLSDLCGRVALFDFETLPQKTAERDALVRWRYQQDLNVPAGDARLAYRVFRPASDQSIMRVLAVAIRPDILDQYERACEDAGLFPVSVGLGSLRLFDLCCPAIKAAARSDEVFFLHAAEGSFAFVAVRGGIPAFLRIKPIRNGAGGESVTSASHVADELVATLQFYTDVHPAGSGEADQGPLRSLFMVGDAMVQAAVDRTTLESLNVQIVPLGWDTAPVSSGIPEPASLPQSGLPALAGCLTDRIAC